MVSIEDTIVQREARRLAEQVRLDRRKSPGDRNRLGQFATPPDLAAQLARYAAAHLAGKAVRLLDPALGTGAFQGALLQALPPLQVQAAVGIEIDQEVAAAASALWAATGLQVTPGDFTRLPPPAPEDRFDLVLTNPPYVRHHHLSPADKALLRGLVHERLGLAVSGLAGLYCYFLLLCDAWTADDGLSIWLLPSEFMDVNYGAPVRRYLSERVTLLHVHRWRPADRQFAEALVTSAVVVFRKRPPPPDHRVCFSLGGALEQPAAGDDRWVTLPALAAETKWTRLSPGAVRAPARARGVTLGDLFNVRRGLVTGANAFFILPREQARERGLPEAVLRPILPGPRALRDAGAVIEADADGWPRLCGQLALVDAAGLQGEDIQRRYPALWRYLEEGLALGLHRGYLTSRRSPWYAQEHRPPAPFLCPYMGRGRDGLHPFRFLWNRSQATAANVYLMLYPRQAVSERLVRPAVQAAVHEALCALDPGSLVRCGRVYGGGLYKLEPSELAALEVGPVGALLFS